MSYWSKLSMKDRADVMKLFLDKGISDLDTMRREYNIFAGGGNTNDADLVDWIIREEGFNTKPEDIGDGKITLGSGLTSKKWHDLYKKRGNKWSAEDNRRAVAEEVANRRRWAEKTIPNWEALPDSSQKALLSYKYNYDFTPTNSPKLFKALADSNFREAARQMDATSKDPKFKEGLMERRLREQEWFLSDLANQSIRRPNQTLAPIDTSLQQITAPAVSTAVTNKYVPSTIHPYTRLENARRAMETAVAFNRMLDNTSIQNNLSEYQFPIGNGYANGGKIHIDPSKKGTFTAAASKHGMGVQEFASRVLANKKDYSPAMVKKANFARNASKWHGLGGNFFDDGGSYSYTKPLDNVFVDSEGNLFDPSVPSARGTIQLPEVIVTTRDPRKAVPTANGLNSLNINNTIKGIVKDYFFGDLSDDEIRRRLYNNVSPYGYFDISRRIKSAVKDNIPFKYSDDTGYFQELSSGKNSKIDDRGYSPNRDDIFAEYLQIPKNERHSFSNRKAVKLKKGKYTPTISRENISYLALDLPDVFKERLIRAGGNIPVGENKLFVNRPLGDFLGEHTIGKGHDSKGEYVSYYDKWDLAPFGGNGEDQSLGIGKPVNIYDRIYLDDYYNIPGEYKGSSYLPEATVYGKKKKP